MYKKLTVAGLVAMLMLVLTGTPAHALFINGGFETGDFTGWTVTPGQFPYPGGLPFPSGTKSVIQWGVSQYSHPVPVAMTSATTMPGQTLDVDPYNGTYMARINDIDGMYHATKLSQMDTITTADLTETLYVNWGAMLVNPSHPIGQQPFFGIDVLRNGTSVYSFIADATTAATPGSGWVIAGSDYPAYPQYGSPLYYKSGTYSQALGAFAAGDEITVEMFVADCAQGGHGGYAFLDGIGTTYQPPGEKVVPEPATMSLLGAGLLGLMGLRRRK